MPKQHKEQPNYFQNMEGALNSFLGIKCTSENDGVTFNFEIAKREARLLYAIFHQRSHISLTPMDGSHQSHFGQNFFFNCFGNLSLQWDEPVSPNTV